MALAFLLSQYMVYCKVSSLKCNLSMIINTCFSKLFQNYFNLFYKFEIWLVGIGIYTVFFIWIICFYLHYLCLEIIIVIFFVCLRLMKCIRNQIIEINLHRLFKLWHISQRLRKNYCVIFVRKYDIKNNSPKEHRWIM